MRSRTQACKQAHLTHTPVHTHTKAQRSVARTEGRWHRSSCFCAANAEEEEEEGALHDPSKSLASKMLCLAHPPSTTQHATSTQIPPSSAHGRGRRRRRMCPFFIQPSKGSLTPPPFSFPHLQAAARSHVGRRRRGVCLQRRWGQ
jgi:hypothetical protein